MSDEFQKSLDNEFNNFKASIDKPNIIIIGATGVGKSSLINDCFGSDLAKAGVGKPVTQHIDSFSCEGVPIVLFDTKGYEVGSEKEKEFMRDVVEHASKVDVPGDRIHLAWYCIQASGSRITDFDIDVVKKLTAKKVPVAIVVTKAELLSESESVEFCGVIKKSLPGISVFETSSRFHQKKWQLEELCQWSTDQLPEALKVAFVAGQKQSLKIKRAAARKIIVQHVTGSVAVGFTPIPLSDAPLLVVNQVAMIARILFVYNLQSMMKALNSTLIMSVVGSVISRSGIWAVGQLLKLIPGVGTIGGGMINATVAASITYAVGASIIEVCEVMINKRIDGGETSVSELVQNVAPIFEEAFKKNYASDQKAAK